MIKVICIGKLKEKYLIDLVNDYEKRINKYHKLSIIELKDSDIYNEEKLILNNISNNEYIILLDIKGNKYDSVGFKNVLNDLFNTSNSNIVFIIGSSYGVSETIKNKASLRISFSDMTFPHGMFRAMLLEQIYRSFKIMNNESYHK